MRKRSGRTDKDRLRLVEDPCGVAVPEGMPSRSKAQAERAPAKPPRPRHDAHLAVADIDEAVRRIWSRARTLHDRLVESLGSLDQATRRAEADSRARWPSDADAAGQGAPKRSPPWRPAARVDAQTEPAAVLGHPNVSRVVSRRGIPPLALDHVHTIGPPCAETLAFGVDEHRAADRRGVDAARHRHMHRLAPALRCHPR